MTFPDIKAYLTRINYDGAITPSVKTLAQLHQAHMFSVPFENLDIHLGHQITIDQRLFYEKIVSRRRGGFCYELNGLFAWLLKKLGFDVTLLSARVFSKEQPGPEFDHLMLLVKLKELWIADVGFGDSFLKPLKLNQLEAQVQGDKAYRLCHKGENIVVSQQDQNKDWQPQYVFSLIPRKLSEFANMCKYHQTSPNSSFTQKRICTIATEDGRLTLSENILITTKNSQRQEINVKEKECLHILNQHFGIQLTEKF